MIDRSFMMLLELIRLEKAYHGRWQDKRGNTDEEKWRSAFCAMRTARRNCEKIRKIKYTGKQNGKQG